MEREFPCPCGKGTTYSALKLGEIERTKEECRDERGVSLVESLFQDLHFGLRMLAKNRALTVIAALSSRNS